MFELRFKEDFDTLDTDRWILGDYTFEDNNAKFVPENAYVEDGELVLKMEKAAGNDNKKPKKPETPDWQVLPAPQPESLDRAIETTTRVVVTMVRSYLEDFSESMSSYLQ